MILAGPLLFVHYLLKIFPLVKMIPFWPTKHFPLVVIIPFCPVKPLVPIMPLEEFIFVFTHRRYCAAVYLRPCFIKTVTVFLTSGIFINVSQVTMWGAGAVWKKVNIKTNPNKKLSFIFCCCQNNFLRNELIRKNLNNLY